MNLSKSGLIYVWLDSLDCFDYKKTSLLHDYFVDITGYREHLEKDKDYFVSEIGEEKYQKLLDSATNQYIKSVIDGLDGKGITVIDGESEYYPKNFFSLDEPPFVLYCKGNLELLKTKMLTVVGSRKSLAYSVNVAKDFVEELSKEFTIVTGLAQGVEKAILDTLCDSERVISILPSGLDKIYPSSHKDVIDKVSKSGLVITSHYLDQECRAYYFIKRNQLLASIGKGVLVINGEEKSGVMQTAENAKELWLPVFALPYSLGIQSGEGPNKLIKEGAKLVTSAQDIFEEFGIENKEKDKPRLSKEEQDIINVLTEPKHVEQIAKEINKQAFEIAPLLSMLEIKGAIIKSGVNIYRLAK